MFELNNIDLEIESPVEKMFELIFEEQAQRAMSSEEQQALETLFREKEILMRCLWDEDMEGNYSDGDLSDGDSDGIMGDDDEMRDGEMGDGGNDELGDEESFDDIGCAECVDVADGGGGFVMGMMMGGNELKKIRDEVYRTPIEVLAKRSGDESDAAADSESPLMEGKANGKNVNKGAERMDALSSESDGKNRDGKNIRGKNADALSSLSSGQNVRGWSWPKYHGTAFSPKIARTNHSCTPNMRFYFDRRDKTLFARAIRPIREGEELVISYCKESATVSRRRKALNEYGFFCRCEKCCAEEGGK